MLKRDKLNSHPLASGTGLLLVCQEYLAISPTPNPNVGDYEGRIGLSPPATNPDRPLGRDANKGNLKPRNHVYTIDYYFSTNHTLSKDSSPYDRTPVTQMDANPASK